MHNLSALSTEYLMVPVAETEQGVTIDPTTQAVELAFTVPAVDPLTGDWHTAEWETDTTDADNPTYSARLLVGPDGGAAVLTAALWEVHLRVTDNPEVIVRRAGSVWVY